MYDLFFTQSLTAVFPLITFAGNLMLAKHAKTASFFEQHSTLMNYIKCSEIISIIGNLRNIRLIFFLKDIPIIPTLIYRLDFCVPKVNLAHK